jgi:hypothetical protein
MLFLSSTLLSAISAWCMLPPCSLWILQVPAALRRPRQRPLCGASAVEEEVRPHRLLSPALYLLVQAGHLQPPLLLLHPLRSLDPAPAP